MSEKNVSMPFIKKAIAKTNAKELSWTSMKGKSNLIHFCPDNDFLGSMSAYTAYSSVTIQTVLYEYDNSYYASFDNGYIFLLTAPANGESYIAISSSKTLIKARDLFLFAQETDASYAKLIASNSDSSETSVQLRRLYNLAEDSALNLDGFINNFLNS